MPIPEPHAVAACTLDDDTRILARTIRGEAEGEPWIGKVAVGHVVLNRKKRVGRFPRSIRGVVLQPWQFSCWGDPRTLPRMLTPDVHDPRSWGECLRAASAVLCGVEPDPTNGSDHYLTDALFRSDKAPRWSRMYRQTVQIGAHRFFRERG